jgi:protoporphyrinogen oxidase
MQVKEQIAVIAGAGPAGLTAALELLRHTNIRPLVFEATSDIGGLSKTVEYKGNRIDIGGHRFFSKSDWVMNWWQEILPIEKTLQDKLTLSYDNNEKSFFPIIQSIPDEDAVMLVRSRLSRIYFRRRFFNYPISLNWDTLYNLGLFEVIWIIGSYLYACLLPRKQELSLEDFLINRFGYRLYSIFFRDYTEKVWGVSCREISAEWGAQRIKGLSITKTIAHALRRLLNRHGQSLTQKDTQTSLIERFLYPKYGPGQMWETVANKIKQQGGSVQCNRRIIKIELEENRVVAVTVTDPSLVDQERIEVDYFISTMPVQELIPAITPSPPGEVLEIAKGLLYRDFLVVGLLLDRLSKQTGGILSDNWIYIQENDVKVGRLQIFNNWSPYLVKDPARIWMGLEYFCNESDTLWNMPDEELIAFAEKELISIGIIEKGSVLDGLVVRMPKAYPAYFGSYDRFDVIRKYTDSIPNLYLIGRNGMHRYNNQDHSMLTARYAVESIKNGGGKDKIWKVNIDDDYHEESVS